MIIRLIGDNWVPEDKIIVSVRDEEDVKVYLPNIMKKLSIKRMSEYRLYFTAGERKCDYLRPIDINSSWNKLGISGGSTIYVSSKEPEIKTEEASGVTNCEAADNPIGIQKDNSEFSTMGQEDVIDNSAQKNVRDIGLSHLPSDGAEKMSLEPPTSHASPPPGETIGTSWTCQAEAHIVDGPKFSEPIVALEGDKNREMTMLPPQRNSTTLGNSDPEEYTSYKKNSSSILQNSMSNPLPHEARTPIPPMGTSVETPLGAYRKEEEPIHRVSVTQNSYPNVLEIQEPPICNTVQRKRGFERDAMLHRYERTAYIVSLYEFAHLELERQRQRAAALRESADKPMVYSQKIVSKPLYKL